MLLADGSDPSAQHPLQGKYLGLINNEFAQHQLKV